VLEHVDASKYDFCAAPMMPSHGAKAVRWKEFGIVTDGPWLGGHRPGCVSGSFRLRLPAGGPPITLRARVCMWGKSQRSDGVTFRVEVVDGKGKRHVFFDRHTHSHEPIPVSVRLSPFAGQEIRLSLVSDCGPNDNCGWDWGAWLSPRVVVGKREEDAKRGNVGTR